MHVSSVMLSLSPMFKFFVCIVLCSLLIHRHQHVSDLEDTLTELKWWTFRLNLSGPRSVSSDAMCKFSCPVQDRIGGLANKISFKTDINSKLELCRIVKP